METLQHWCESYDITGCIVSSTVDMTPVMRDQISAAARCEVVYLDAGTPIPLRNLYATPQTLGPDRLAASVGAHYEAMQLTGHPCPTLVIDMGTAITYDYVTEAGEYIGGNISPGVDMRLRALNAFTEHLPLVSATGDHPTLGTTTETAIRCGVLDGVKHEINGFMQAFLDKYPCVLFFLTGGAMFDFEERLKSRTFADEFLVHKGLEVILTHIIRTAVH